MSLGCEKFLGGVGRAVSHREGQICQITESKHEDLEVLGQRKRVSSLKNPEVGISFACLKKKRKVWGDEWWG